jgi:Xaa-Pro aminopeptidase
MIDSQTYTDRRSKLAEQIHHPIVLTAHTALQAKSDMAYKFVQEPSFLYYTGINEPDWKLLFDGSEWHLERPSISSSKELFDGSLASDVATQISGVVSVLVPNEVHSLLENAAKKFKKVATLAQDPMKKYYEFSQNPAQARLNRSLSRVFSETVNCRAVVRRARALKSAEELDVQQRAIDLTVKTFAEVRAALPRFSHEFEIEAVFNAAFRATGAGGHAYDPIVASGAHACTLHYGENRDALPKNGLVLIDIGAQVGGYAADITRTYALGTPSTREVQVHAAVEAAHKAIIALIKPGLLFAKYQDLVDDIMKDALHGLGLLYSYDDNDTYRKYFPHAIGHGLGIDVHESLGGYDSFQAGMVLTVEPGIYIPEEGIGVRIEDDILVTTTGNKNLSADLPTSLL